MCVVRSKPVWPGLLLVAGVFVLAMVGAAGCARELMPTPYLYWRGEGDPFAEVPAELRTSYADVFYVTDRVSDGGSERRPRYGYGRSRSMAFGVARLSLGRGVSWDELVAASRSRSRLVNLRLDVGEAEELGRFPRTPPRWVQNSAGEWTDAPEDVAQRTAAEEAFQAALRQRLAPGPCKDVYLYVHGFNNTFADSVEVIGQVWHFLGRRGVPLAYSWPAGRGGVRGYAYDRESGEFTIYHLKSLLRLLGACPEVGRVHVLAHSRGTDVAVTALRELHLECTAAGRRTGEVLKLGTVVLASPDIDLDVALQKLADERLFRVPEATVIYVSEGDWALQIANWLFLGMSRLGRVRPSELPREELAVLQESQAVQLVDTYDASTGLLGHSDFYWSPAVSSDLILVLRDHRKPGAEHGRPLGVEQDGFWRISRDYPRTE